MADVMAGYAPGQVVRAGELTDMQERFVMAMIGQNITPREAAISAGYSEKSAANIGGELIRDPKIQRAIHAAVARTIGTDGQAIAWRTMKELMQDKKVAPQVRFQAAKWTLTVAGHVEPATAEAPGLPDKPLSEYSAAELERFISMATVAIGGAQAELRTLDAADDAAVVIEAPLNQ